MIDVQQFADLCGNDLPGIPAPMLKQLIVEIGRELCREGRLFRLTLPDIALDGSSEYDLAPSVPAGTTITDIDVVTIDGKPVDPIGRSATRIPSTSRWTRIVGDSVSHIFIHQDPGSGVLSVSTILLPLPTATQLPDVLFNEWIEGVRFGVNAKAMAMAKKEWSNVFVSRTGKVFPGQSLAYNQNEWLATLGKARGYGRAGNATDRKRTLDGFMT